jgi:hypothetical protein
MKWTSRTLLAAALALAACGGSSPTGPVDTPDISPTAVGAPSGIAVTTTIGPEGGTLASADGRLRVAVPAGAVAAPTEFSVQPIENEAWGAVGTAYRLTPHGTTFAKPVRLTIGYEEADIAGTTAAQLRLASQDAQGYWRVYRAAEVDETARTVTVLAPHFSDWSAVAGATLYALKSTVEVGGTVGVRVRDCFTAEPEHEDDLLAPLAYECRDGLWGVEVAEWSVNGTRGGGSSVGTISEREPGTALYTAPSTVPGGNPVAISVKYTGAEPDDRGLLVTHVRVTDGSGACAALRDITTWNANFGVAYDYSGTRADQDQIGIVHRAEVTARLAKSGEGPAGVSWIGHVTGTTSVNDRHVDRGTVEDDVTTVAGGGSPMNATPISQGSRVYLNVDLRDCRYNVGFVGYMQATTTFTGSPERVGDIFLMSARSGWRPLLGGTNLTEGRDFTAHTEEWGLANSGDAYFLGGLGSLIFDEEFAADGQAGTARVEWSFQPEG